MTAGDFQATVNVLQRIFRHFSSEQNMKLVQTLNNFNIRSDACYDNQHS